MRLRPNQVCPIHRSTSCCGREFIPTPRLIRLGVQRIEDPHHPRGYRELRSPAEMWKLLNRKIVEQDRICPICHEEFTDYNDIVPDPGRSPLLPAEFSQSGARRQESASSQKTRS